MPSLRSLTGVVLGALVLLAVGAAPAHADKCTGAKLKAVGKKDSGLLGCQAKVAATGDSSGLAARETKAMGKFAAAFAKAGTCAGNQPALTQPNPGSGTVRAQSGGLRVTPTTHKCPSRLARPARLERATLRFEG